MRKLKIFNPKLVFLFCLIVVFASCKKGSDLGELKRNYGIFTVESDNKTIEMSGVIKSRTLNDFQKLRKNFPNINLINIKQCDGSMDDEINLKVSLLVHQDGIDTHLLDNAEIASGGVDFFLAGNRRSRGKNTRLGVHSWGDGKTNATDFPKGHKYHLEYIKYYQDVGFTKKEAEDFYYFTIYAAPPENVHWMTEEEIIKHKMFTK